MDKQALIDKAVEDLEGSLPTEIGGKCNIGEYYGRMDTGSLYRFEGVGVRQVRICTAEQFTHRAKELGWINGYKWGKEYPTNGNKPDLPKDLRFKVTGKMIGGHAYQSEFVVDECDWNDTITFCITDSRYKPKQPESHSKPVKDLSDVIFAASDAISVAVDAGAIPSARELQKINRDLLAKDSVIGIGKLSGDASWHEKGELPPVGWKGLVNNGGDTDYFECEIVAYHYNGKPILKTKGSSHNMLTEKPDCWKFRPIKTEKEKFVEAASEIMHQSQCGVINDISLVELYEAGCRFVSQESSS